MPRNYVICFHHGDHYICAAITGKFTEIDLLEPLVDSMFSMVKAFKSVNTTFVKEYENDYRFGS